MSYFIKKAFDKCLESIKCVESQTGGLDQLESIDNNKTYKITYYNNKLNEIYNKINISNID